MRFSPRSLLLALIGLCLLVMAEHASAATYYWVGTRNNSDRWETAANWSSLPRGAGGAGIPGTNDKAVLNFSGTTVRLRSEVNIHDLILSNVWTGSLVFGTGNLLIGFSDQTGTLRMGSGRIISSNRHNAALSAPVFTVYGTYVQTGGIVSNLQNDVDDDQSAFAVTGDFTVRSVSGTRPQFLALTGTFLQVPLANSTMTVGTSNTTFNIGNLFVAGILTPSTVTFSGSSLRLANGNLFVTNDGTLDLETYSVPFSISGSISIGAAGDTLRLGGTTSLSGSIASNGALRANGQTIIMNGAAAQSISLSASTTQTISGLTILSTARVSLASTIAISPASTLTVGTGSKLALNTRRLFATGANIVNYGVIAEESGRLVHTASDFASADSSFAAKATFEAEQERVYVTITDADENGTGTLIETLTVTASLGNGDTETILLTETTVRSGVFRGSVATAVHSAPSSGNGALELAAGSTPITLSYTDSQDGFTNSASATLTLPTTSTAGSGGSSGGGGGGGGSRGATLTRRQDTAASSPKTPSVVPRAPSPLVVKMCERALTRLERYPLRARERGIARLGARCGW